MSTSDYLDSDFIYIGSLGMWVGSIIGAMARVTPYQMTLLLAIVVGIAAWLPNRPTMAEFLITAGVTTAGIFGTMTGNIPWGVSIFAILLFLALLWKQYGMGGRGRVSPLIMTLLFVVVSTGLYYGSSYNDFCLNNFVDFCGNPANWVHGQPTIYAGCVSTCQFTAFTLFGSSSIGNALASFLFGGGAVPQGDFPALLGAFFINFTQTIPPILAIAAGFIMLLIGTGLGFNIVANTFFGGGGGGITPNAAGTRTAQSLGIGLLVFGFIFLGFDGFFTAFGPVNTFMGLFGIGLEFLLATVIMYGFYMQGKDIAGD